MKPLTYNEDMAKAREEGRKTQMRIPIDPQPIADMWFETKEVFFDNYRKSDFIELFSPYKIGDTVPAHDEHGNLIGHDEIIIVRVERLQDISDQDIRKEGYYGVGDSFLKVKWFRDKIWQPICQNTEYSWNSNPWVWVIEFRKVD